MTDKAISPLRQRMIEDMTVRGLASRPGDSHPQALPEPCLNLSAHTAPDVRPFP